MAVNLFPFPVAGHRAERHQQVRIRAADDVDIFVDVLDQHQLLAFGRVQLADRPVAEVEPVAEVAAETVTAQQRDHSPEMAAVDAPDRLDLLDVDARQFDDAVDLERVVVDGEVARERQHEQRDDTEQQQQEPGRKVGASPDEVEPDEKCGDRGEGPPRDAAAAAVGAEIEFLCRLVPVGGIL